ncbi:MAG: DUF503 domain-containing protein [Desulfobacterales bacterium]|nr:DUF503 domain-containing protein [Desulfobacterales bacterium]MBF0395826.1 DUF503 domain-containing protein [Desulfobacterales bacterium]
MVVGIGRIVFKIHECHSLKEKRPVVKSIIAKLRNSFNASVAEVGANDMHQRIEIGFALVGNDSSLINSKVDKLLDFAEELNLADIIDSEMEIITL